MSKLTYIGNYQINGKSIDFNVKLVLDYISAKNVSLSEIDQFKPFQLFACDDFHFTCKVYDEHNNCFKTFVYHNGHYAKLMPSDDLGSSPIECSCTRDDWQDDNLSGYVEHMAAIKSFTSYMTPLQYYVLRKETDAAVQGAIV